MLNFSHSHVKYIDINADIYFYAKNLTEQQAKIHFCKITKKRKIEETTLLFYFPFQQEKQMILSDVCVI